MHERAGARTFCARVRARAAPCMYVGESHIGLQCPGSSPIDLLPGGREGCTPPRIRSARTRALCPWPAATRVERECGVTPPPLRSPFVRAVGWGPAAAINDPAQHTHTRRAFLTHTHGPLHAADGCHALPHVATLGGFRIKGGCRHALPCPDAPTLAHMPRAYASVSNCATRMRSE
jgi:hypothetical protein